MADAVDTPLLNRVTQLIVTRTTIPKVASSYVTNPLGPGESLTINPELRVRFSITRSLSKTPDQADLYVYNLAENTRHDLAVLPLQVQFSAGYNNTPRLLFLGDAHFGMSEPKGPDWETLLQCGDGDRTYGNARTNKSFPAGTSYLTVLKAVAASMNVALPTNVLNDSALQKQFVSGKSVRGWSAEELTKLLAPFGYHWSSQNGRLQVLRDEDGNNADSPYLIDEDHGLISSPEHGAPPKSGKSPHVKVRVLLAPEIMPGDCVQITSESLKGLYKAVRVRHVGDTWGAGSEFETQLEVLPYPESAVLTPVDATYAALTS